MMNMAELTRLAEALWGVWLSFSPFLLLGALLAGVLHVALPEGFISRHLSGRAGVWRSVLFGVPLPLCSCGVIPTGLGLKRDGASDGATMGFLISTPQTGVDSILVSGVALGWPFALSKVFAAMITGLVGGWLADRVGEATTGTSAEGQCEAPLSPTQAQEVHEGHEHGAEGSTLKALLAHALEVIEPIWGWVLVGVLASALIELYLPATSLSEASAYGGLMAMLISLSLSLPLYVCATSSVPIAAALVAKGFPVGAALVFLMAGPATNFATMGAIYRALGGKQLAVYLGTLISGSVLFGLLFESTLGALSVSHTHAHAHEHSPALWELGAALIMAALFIALIAGWVRRLFKGRAAPTSHAMILSVSDVTCGGCVRKIERALGERKEQKGDVLTFYVSRGPDEVMIEGVISEQEARALLEGLGHPVTAVQAVEASAAQP